MKILKILTLLTLIISLTGCLGGGVQQSSGKFSAHGGTFNILTFKVDFVTGDSHAMDVASRHVPSGAKVTSVNHNPDWRALAFPWNVLAFFNEYLIGADYCQISGTTK